MIGIDEAGRGAWAGPLTVAGCYFTKNPTFIHELNDSKQLTGEQRERLEPLIMSVTIFEIVHVESASIDKYGLSECMRRATLTIAGRMPDHQPIVIDGVINYLVNTPYGDRSRTEIKADSRFPCVMAASILAKVARDRLMFHYGTIYPEYGFETNVGYGTSKHIAALKRHGLLSIHRKTYKPVAEIKLL
jgi:ribonuclease HII